MTKSKTITDYVEESKIDVYLYIIVALFLFYFLFLVSYQYNFYGFYVFEVIFLLKVFEKVMIYKNVKKIKEEITKQNFPIKKEKVLFWNENNLFLTSKYFLVLYEGKVQFFEYKEIVDIKEFKKEKVIDITLQNKETITIDKEKKFDIEKYCDIEKYLLEKINQ